MLKEVTYLDINLAYEGQEIEDLSFDEDGYLWFMDCRRNLYRTDFNANEYGLNKNPKIKTTSEIITEESGEKRDLFERILDVVQVGIEYFSEEELEEKLEEENNQEEQEIEKTRGYPIEIPKNLGKEKSFGAFNNPNWIPDSNQDKFYRKVIESNPYPFDSDGFGMVNGSYVVAVTKKFGKIGDFVEFTLANGEKIPCIIGDIKNEEKDPDCNEYGHHEGRCILEFYGDINLWYHRGYGDIAKEFRQEWYGQAVVGAYNTGYNYNEYPDYVIPSEEEKEEEKNGKLTFEKFQNEKLFKNKNGNGSNTVCFGDSEMTRREWIDAINAGDPNGTVLYAKNGAKPLDFYLDFKDNQNFLKGLEYIIVEVGPNDLNDWNSMKKFLDLLVERRESYAKIYFEQIESTSGCKDQLVIDAFNQHLRDYQDTHEKCYYIETRAYPNNLLDENGKVKYCDKPGLHFLEGLNIGGENVYELWAKNTAYAIYEKEKELESQNLNLFERIQQVWKEGKNESR